MRSKTKEKIELAEKQLAVLAPKNSSIRSIIFTEEQFQKMKILSGEVTIGERILKRIKMWYNINKVVLYH